MDLKWLLVRRVTLVALACLFAGSAFAVWQTAGEAKRQNVELVEAVARQLESPLASIVAHFPDWDLVTSYALQPGQCVRLIGPDASIRRSSCAGVNTAAIDTPRWFFEVYRALIDSEASASRELTFRGKTQGAAVASFDPVATASLAWATIAPLISLSAALIAALCLVAYFVIDRALRPTKDILSGLNRLAKGDLACRLPAFRLTEFNRISEVFNSLTSDLSKATSERAELARRLVDAQERERRHIARELHDEIAQKLTAINALAACIRTGAQREAPSVVGDARDLEKMASDLMITLRKTLVYLRPQEIDDLGLVASLEGLVREHNESAAGRTRYTLETDGDIEELRAETSAHVYRIIQEALNNASKHANARNVKVLLNQQQDAGREKISLAVVDDGFGPPAPEKRSPYLGSGLIGMRERVLALSGSFNAGPLPSGGFGLRVEFPTVQGGA